MRPPPRPLSSRCNRPGAVSPAESIASVATSTTSGMKRKERDFENGDEETNINVVVRCRGRNEREIKENSGIVLLTNGVKSKSLEISMGPNALNNKTYNFDKVFSSAADQAMIYDDVVAPIIREMLSGFNCTIFAYGQTGTGKTYTMTGDTTETYEILSDAAGIIPRALHTIFSKLEMNDAEWSVKCSFIELYNEELRDLISRDDSTKLKIYDDNSNKKGNSSTIVQGMEETHIKSATEGIKLLQSGSLKRQVAATKCNDLSSRSHTVFTVTVYIKETAENGEDYLNAGKLNLVDLAGSENIQRSGAENKRAAEAGLINKSLLTLGRVINALVDKSSHIPYRESKLTRLLQDSLGGRTKTCIIATVSPTKSNLEETISTLDYAFRAKNIRNKPQVNQTINKKTLLKEFTAEIEKLKSELIATRQRNGVYLSNDSYEEIIVQSESRRILNEELASKIGLMEKNLRNKVQELFNLTTSFMNLKKDNEGTKVLFDEIKTLLEQTEKVLETTRKSLADESILRKAHQETEKKLRSIGSDLISTLNRTVHDINSLHAKNRRKSDLNAQNLNTWGLAQTQAIDVTNMVELRINEFKNQQQELINKMSSRVQSFVFAELENLSTAQVRLDEQNSACKSSLNEISEKKNYSEAQMNEALNEIKTMRENIKTSAGEGLGVMSASAERISAEVICELGTFRSQLKKSYSSLGRDFNSLFEDLMNRIQIQRSEADSLREQLITESEILSQSTLSTSSKLNNILRAERDQAVIDRQELLAQITTLIMAQGESQECRLNAKICGIQKDVLASKERFDCSRTKFEEGTKVWNQQEERLLEQASRSRDIFNRKLEEGLLAAENQNVRLHDATNSIHDETLRIVDIQMHNIENQMHLLDDFVTKAKSKNSQLNRDQDESLKSLSATVHSSYSDIKSCFISTHERIDDFGQDLTTNSKLAGKSLEPLDSLLSQPLTQLRDRVSSMHLQKYVATGKTPPRSQYSYPTLLPQTDDHEIILKKYCEPTEWL